MGKDPERSGEDGHELARANLAPSLALIAGRFGLYAARDQLWIRQRRGRILRPIYMTCLCATMHTDSTSFARYVVSLSLNEISLTLFAARPGRLPAAHRLLLPRAFPAAFPRPCALSVSVRKAPRDRPRAVSPLLVRPRIHIQPRQRLGTRDGDTRTGGGAVHHTRLCRPRCACPPFSHFYHHGNSLACSSHCA